MEITLRKWEAGDLSSLVKHANNRNVAQFLTDMFPHPYTVPDGENFIETVRLDDPTRVFAIDINGEAVGCIGIFPQSDVHCCNAELGYWLSEEFWGRGFMVEAIKKIVEYGFDTFPINRIFARPFGHNNRSIRVLEKAGFTQEAFFPNTIFKNGEYYDEFYFSILSGQLGSEK